LGHETPRRGIDCGDLAALLPPLFLTLISIFTLAALWCRQPSPPRFLTAWLHFVQFEQNTVRRFAPDIAKHSVLDDRLKVDIRAAGGVSSAKINASLRAIDLEIRKPAIPGCVP
jgi:hypothetical protein